MVVDSSAFVAILLKEPGYESIQLKVADDPLCMVSSVTYMETSIVLVGKGEEAAFEMLDNLLRELQIQISPVTREHAELAREAWERFGKGRHPAKLNLGDCFSCALAKQTGQPLLFVGNDFSQTDILAA